MKKVELRTATIADAVSEAFGEIQALAEEMREAFDNTPESLQSSVAGEARGEAADNLEQIEEVDVPDALKDVQLQWQDAHEAKGRRGLSRSKRRENAISILQSVMSLLDENEDSESDENSEFYTALENAIGEMESVEFPGMYG